MTIEKFEKEIIEVGKDLIDNDLMNIIILPGNVGICLFFKEKMAFNISVNIYPTYVNNNYLTIKKHLFDPQKEIIISDGTYNKSILNSYIIFVKYLNSNIDIIEYIIGKIDHNYIMSKVRQFKIGKILNKC